MAAFHPCRTASFRWLRYRERGMERLTYVENRLLRVAINLEILITR